MQHRLTSIDEIAVGESREFTVGDRIVALYRVKNEFFAMDGICPHAGGPLGEGMLQGTIVTCPWHGWQFDVSTGKHCLTPHIGQQCFPVVIKDNDIYVELP